MTFLLGNQSVSISDYIGTIKKIKWQADTNSGDGFDFNEGLEHVGNCHTESICLTKDREFNLLDQKHY